MQCSLEIFDTLSERFGSHKHVALYKVLLIAKVLEDICKPCGWSETRICPLRVVEARSILVLLKSNAFMMQFRRLGDCRVRVWDEVQEPCCMEGTSHDTVNLL